MLDQLVDEESGPGFPDSQQSEGETAGLPVDVLAPAPGSDDPVIPEDSDAKFSWYLPARRAILAQAGPRNGLERCSSRRDASLTTISFFWAAETG